MANSQFGRGGGGRDFAEVGPERAGVIYISGGKLMAVEVETGARFRAEDAQGAVPGALFAELLLVRAFGREAVPDEQTYASA